MAATADNTNVQRCSAAEMFLNDDVNNINIAKVHRVPVDADLPTVQAKNFSKDTSSLTKLERLALETSPSFGSKTSYVTTNAAQRS